MKQKTMRRDVLKRKVDRGELEVKRNQKLTDDYAWDADTNFGKTDWMPARISRPVFEDRKLQNGNIMSVCVDDDRKPGHFNFGEYMFNFQTGRAYLNEDGTIDFYPLSSENYTFRPKQN